MKTTLAAAERVPETRWPVQEHSKRTPSERRLSGTPFGAVNGRQRRKAGLMGPVR